MSRPRDCSIYILPTKRCSISIPRLNIQPRPNPSHNASHPLQNLSHSRRGKPVGPYCSWTIRSITGPSYTGKSHYPARQHAICSIQRFVASEVGGCSTGKSFRFDHACVHAVRMPSGTGSQTLWAGLFPFPFGPGLNVEHFLFLGLGGLGERSLFPFGAAGFPFSLPPPPQTSYPTLVGLIGKQRSLEALQNTKI